MNYFTAELSPRYRIIITLRLSIYLIPEVVGVKASRITIETAFFEVGYGRYSPRSKPNLTLEIREKRYR